MKQSPKDNYYENPMKIRIEIENFSMYELGYLSVDLAQLLFFCVLLADRDYEKLYKYFGDEDNYQQYRLTRNSGEFKEYSRRIEILEVNKGSIEYLLQNAPALISLILAVISIKVAIKTKEYKFYYDIQDVNIDELLDTFEGNKKSGLDTEQYNWLVGMLNHRGYKIEVSSHDIYLIDKVTDQYAKRFERIIK